MSVTVPWSGFDLINAFNRWKTSESAARMFVVAPDGTTTRQVTGRDGIRVGEHIAGRLPSRGSQPSGCTTTPGGCCGGCSEGFARTQRGSQTGQRPPACWPESTIVLPVSVAASFMRSPASSPRPTAGWRSKTYLWPTRSATSASLEPSPMPPGQSSLASFDTRRPGSGPPGGMRALVSLDQDLFEV
jgi:hypothetical protein